MKKFALAAAFAATLMMASPLMAAEKEGGAKAVVTGVNVSLAKEFAGDDKGEFTKTNALKVTEAKDADGKAIADMKGKILYYVPSAKAEKLSVGADNVGKTVTVTGTVWADSSALGVESFEASAEDDDWGDVPIGTQSNKQIL